MFGEAEPKIEKLSLVRKLIPLVGIMATLVYASSLARVKPAAPELFQFDKIAHFFVFGLMGTLWFRVLRIPFPDTKRWIVAFLLVIAFGVLDEILQYFNPNRSFDPYDWIADASGAFVGIFVYRGWALYRRILETPVVLLIRFKIVA